MNEREHRELQNSLGAFVLNAVSALEYRQIERHVQACAQCAREVRLLREASTELAWLPTPEDPDDLVDRISASLPRRPRRIGTRVAAGIAAVSIAAAGFLGVSFIRERNQNAEITDVLASANRRVDLTSQGGFDGRGVLHLASGKAVLVLDDVPDAGRDRAYQLWAVTGKKPRSMTVVRGEGRLVDLFDWTGGAASYAVTIEPAGGSPVPTSDPVLAGRY